MNAMNPDPHMLKAHSAIDCANGVLINNQVLQRNSKRDESTAIAAQATAIPPYFNSLITAHLLRRNPTPSDKRHIPDGTMRIRVLRRSKRGPDVSRSSLASTSPSLAA
jgi:hypothetical protein